MIAVGGDCDDTDPTINPAALEICGGSDENCNGLTGDSDPTLDPASTEDWYLDVDGDNYGTGSAVYACLQPVGYGAEPDDCDDTDPNRSPGTPEISADGIDQDCDGEDRCEWFYDADLDGYGDPSISEPGCTQPAGYVNNDQDCDDTDATISPAATELWYDGLDSNCDGKSDFDQDGDGVESLDYGGDDCDDLNNSIFPEAPEICDAVDQDCDGALDEDACPCPSATYNYHSYLFCSDLKTWTEAEFACEGMGYELASIEDGLENSWLWSEAELYNDATAWWFGLSDQAVEGSFVWMDGSTPVYTSWRSGEPNDFNGAEDCGKFTDDAGGLWNDGNCADAWSFICEAGCALTFYYPDADGDGYGDTSLGVASCEPVEGLIVQGGDCDDADLSINPIATELCGGGDEDCDGLEDDADDSLDSSTTEDWYLDLDNDGYGTGDPLYACAKPEGYGAESGDCADDDSGRHPGATEAIDGIDNDCDGYTETDDKDGDGLDYLTEAAAGSDPDNPDSDGDSVSDGDEVEIVGGKVRDTDGDGKPDWNDTDDDEDRVPTADESGDIDITTEPVDTDADGIPDYRDSDSDNDSVWDGAEAGVDHDGDGIEDRLDTDDDGDGLATLIEATVDVDGDGGSDYDVDGDGTPNHLDLDTDGDGCLDSEEGEAGFADGVCAKDEKKCGCAAAEGGPAGLALIGIVLLKRRRSSSQRHENRPRLPR
jgi:MYXO-CTERM domain-containing protein